MTLRDLIILRETTDRQRVELDELLVKIFPDRSVCDKTPRQEFLLWNRMSIAASAQHLLLEQTNFMISHEIHSPE